MIDVGGAALLGAAARNAAGVAAVADPAHYPQVVAELRELGTVSRRDRAPSSPPRRSARSPPTTPRSPPTSTRSRATTFPQPPRDGPREGRRPALRREPAPARGVLPRDDPPQRDARRRDPAPGRAAVVQQPARPRRRVPDRARLHGADGRDRQAHRPGRAGLARRARRGLPARPRDRPGRVVRRDRRGQPRARRGDRPRDRGELVRGGRRARASASRRSASCAASPASSCSPSRPTRPRACATTASPTSTSSASPAACSSRRLDDLGLDRGQLQVVTKRRPTLEELTDLLFAWRAVRHVRSNAIVLARNGATVGIGAGAGAAARSRSRSRCAGPATGPSSRSWRRTPTSRSPTASRSRPSAGVTAIIQPGGSIRDEMAIEVADRHHMAMVFTGRRHFRH